jgi:hypothetical protein
MSIISMINTTDDKAFLRRTGKLYITQVFAIGFHIKSNILQAHLPHYIHSIKLRNQNFIIIYRTYSGHAVAKFH